MIYHILSFPYTPTLEFISRKQCITYKEINNWIFFSGMEGVARERCAHSILQS